MIKTRLKRSLYKIAVTTLVSPWESVDKDAPELEELEEPYDYDAPQIPNYNYKIIIMRALLLLAPKNY